MKTTTTTTTTVIIIITTTTTRTIITINVITIIIIIIIIWYCCELPLIQLVVQRRCVLAQLCLGKGSSHLTNEACGVPCCPTRNLKGKRKDQSGIKVRSNTMRLVNVRSSRLQRTIHPTRASNNNNNALTVAHGPHRARVGSHPERKHWVNKRRCTLPFSSTSTLRQPLLTR